MGFLGHEHTFGFEASCELWFRGVCRRNAARRQMSRHVSCSAVHAVACQARPYSEHHTKWGYAEAGRTSVGDSERTVNNPIWRYAPPAAIHRRGFRRRISQAGFIGPSASATHLPTSGLLPCLHLARWPNIGGRQLLDASSRLPEAGRCVDTRQERRACHHTRWPMRVREGRKGRLASRLTRHEMDVQDAVSGDSAGAGG